ncbi:XdhC family protein [Streptomyces sp. NPDC001292]|uniref:XdhC family protein n=1 Tax=Streptomyces sp. NPDC001292 TaxID=3364558 RepID=UPI003688DA8A
MDGTTSAAFPLPADPGMDVPLLQVALRLPDVGHIGALGSRRTHRGRWNRPTEAGLIETELERLSSPIGLDRGARTPEESAVSIAAEIIALKGGGCGLRLTDRPTGRGRSPRFQPLTATAPTAQLDVAYGERAVQKST